MNTPDWNNITFDVPCLHCQTTLNGQQSHCPGCAVVLQWERVLPVDDMRCMTCGYRVFGLEQPRCPECGTTVAWNQVLEIARLGHSHLLEIRWPRRLLHALGITWGLAAFKPSTLWRQYSPSAPFRLWPLVLFLALQVTVFVRGFQTAAWFVLPLMNTLSDWLDQPWTFIYFVRLPVRSMIFAGFWFLCTLLSFQLFWQSLRHAGVRWSQLFRILVHASAFASLTMMLWCVLEACLDASLFFTPLLNQYGEAPYRLLGRSVITAAVIATWYRLWIGIRLHLSMPRGWAIAALVMTLGHLFAQLLMIYF